MSGLYCAICLYPAPCGRDHGEDRDGNPVTATVRERVSWDSRYHVYFDGNLDALVAHVCAAHRAEALALPCEHCTTEGEDCPHVQHVMCECGNWPDCDICADERELVG